MSLNENLSCPSRTVTGALELIVISLEPTLTVVIPVSATVASPSRLTPAGSSKAAVNFFSKLDPPLLPSTHSFPR